MEIKVTGECSEEATFTSSAPEIASISETGKTVLLHAAGKTEITATAAADTSKKDTITLTVEPIVPEVVSIAILDENGAPYENGKFQVDLAEKSFKVSVSVEVQGEMTEEYTLTSSAPDIAQVGTDGDISLLKTGTARLVATAKGDEDVSDALELTVYDGHASQHFRYRGSGEERKWRNHIRGEIRGYGQAGTRSGGRWNGVCGVERFGNVRNDRRGRHLYLSRNGP